MNTDRRVLRCIAEGRQGQWEAVCLDFDLAVQGDSFDEVYHQLNDMIVSYVQEVCEYEEKDRTRLLSRRAPFLLRLKFVMMYIVAFLFVRKADKERHNYTALAECVA